MNTLTTKSAFFNANKVKLKVIKTQKKVQGLTCRSLAKS